MGLDMSLILKKSPTKGRHKEKLTVRRFYKDGKEFDFEFADFNTGKIKHNQKLFDKADKVVDEYELIYWRKANAIHKWFVDHVQEGNDSGYEYRVNQRQLNELYTTIVDVLSHCKLKRGTIRNGWRFKKFLWFTYKSYYKEKGRVLSRRSIKYCNRHLPTQAGFFFGSTDYDEFYYNDLLYTRDKLEYVLSTYNADIANIYYSSSW